jgi:hypothetical protein
MRDLREPAIHERLRQAMKERSQAEVSVLRGMIAAIQNAKIEKRIPAQGELPPADLVQILRREIRQREEALGFAERGGRTDLIEKNRFERDYLAAWLPRPPTRDELLAAIGRHAEAGATTVGELMAKLREEFGARLDGRTASEVAREFLRRREET